jgi:HlyD family secretion protein
MRAALAGLLGILAVAAAGFAGWRWWGGDAPPPGFSGYVEAEYVMVTSVLGGTLSQLAVARGERVAAGDTLFILDDAAERGARDEAAARLHQAEAQLADLLLGRRPAEIEQLVAQRNQAEAMLHQSEADLQRIAPLFAGGNASRKQLDDARAQRDRDRARLTEMDAQLQVARLPARADQIKAAEAAAAAAGAQLRQAEWRLAQMAGRAPADALVVDTLYRPGELVAAGQPVVQLLPPANLKIRFFVPEGRVAEVAVGQVVQVACDGCGPPVAATVRFISPQAEFTPPVIYSREQRARLSFMVEARPNARADALRVGQPVDVIGPWP